MAMDRLGLIRLHLEHIWEKESWIPPLLTALEGIGPAEAAWQPPGGGNTIWQTLNHMNYYNERILNSILGKPIEPQMPNGETFGKPGDPEDTEGWNAAVEQARQVIAEIMKSLKEMRDAELDRELASTMSLAEVLSLWMMHDAYHTGQIVLIRKQQGSWPASRG